MPQRQRHASRLQTLKARLNRAGVRPRTRLGQNFLLDPNQTECIARAGALEARDVVLEVGPGTGALTRVLAASGCRILGVELDRRLLAMAANATQDLPNVALMEGDVLARKQRINPAVCDRVRALLAKAGPDARLKSVSSLPYSAGTPFVANLFASDLPWARAVFLLQAEVAERLVAAPDTPAYGALSVRAALGGRVELARRIPPEVFWPRPKVESALVVVDFLPAPERLALPWDALRALVREAFQSRRKALRNALKHWLAAPGRTGLLETLGIDPARRAGTLAPGEYLALARAGAPGAFPRE